MTVELEDVRAWVDGELVGDYADAVAAAVSNNDELKQAADAMRASQLPFAEAYANTPTPELPESLIGKINELKNTSVNSVQDEQIAVVADAVGSDAMGANYDQATSETVSEKKPPFKMLGMAASVMAAALLGFFAGSSSNEVTVLKVAENDPPTSSAPNPENFVRTVTAYQTLYARDTLIGTDNSPAAVEALTQRLSSQTGMDIVIPKLEGYEFVRAQHLEYGGAPLLQLVYLGAEGVPLALCFMPTQQQANGQVAEDVKLGSYYGLNTAEWMQNERRVVMVSDAPHETMQELSLEAQQQWSL